MPAHVKSSMFGCSLTIPITNGRLNLGTWQGDCRCRARMLDLRLPFKPEGDPVLNVTTFCYLDTQGCGFASTGGCLCLLPVIPGIETFIGRAVG